VFLSNAEKRLFRGVPCGSFAKSPLYERKVCISCPDLSQKLLIVAYSPRLMLSCGTKEIGAANFGDKMSLPKIEVTIRAANNPGVTKAHADVRLLLPNGEIDLIGFAVIKQPGKKLFVGFPQNRGRNKYFPVVQASGEIEEELTKAVLRAFEKEEEKRQW
jgi:DNA-binding cell septation regulator SpoVG